MGMMIDRRRVCGGKKEDTYIQDGLIFWLDGIDKGSDDTAWIEKVNGYRFTGTAVREDNCYSFNNQYLNNSNYVGANANNYTIEFCIETTTVSGVIIASNTWNVTNKDVFVNIRTGQLFNYTSSYSLKVSANQKQTCSISKDNEYILNGNHVSRIYSINTNWDNDGGTNLGKRGRSGYEMFFVGKIYAIRIYNRQLSESEILNNQELDNKRFNLGINTL